MKKTLIILMMIGCILIMVGCSATKILHCDNCNKEVEVQKSSNMEESWLIYCEGCNEELFGDNPLLNGK